MDAPQTLDYATPLRVRWSVSALISGICAAGVALMLVLFFASNDETFTLAALFLGLIAGLFGIAGVVETRRPGVKGRPGAVLGIAAGLLMLLVLLAVLTTPTSRASEAANRVKCGSNVRQIGQALRAYVSDHGAYPPDLETLVANSDLIGEVLVCPSSNCIPSPPPYQLGKNCDYLYLASGLRPDTPGDQIVVVEPTLHSAAKGQRPAAHVLNAYGQVTLLAEAEARRVFSSLGLERATAQPATRSAAPPAPSR